MHDFHKNPEWKPWFIEIYRGILSRNLTMDPLRKQVGSAELSWDVVRAFCVETASLLPAAPRFEGSKGCSSGVSEGSGNRFARCVPTATQAELLQNSRVSQVQ